MSEPSRTQQQQPSACRELQCVGKLEITRPKPVGFLCGSIPVPTDKSFRSHSFNSSALIPSTVSAPRYRMLPTETDLNSPPVVTNFPDKVLPLAAKASADLPLEDGTITSNLSRKGEALAVSGLVEYGDEIDVIAPADVLKQIFKIPYSKARLSIAVRRVGQTLILNTGPDAEEGEKLVRRHHPSKSADQSLFLNFAMHSVRMEACDCPPGHNVSSEEQPNSSVLPRRDTSHLAGQSVDHRNDGLNYDSEYPQGNRDGLFWNKNKNKKCNSHDPIRKASKVGEMSNSSVQESEKHIRIGNNGFLRVLFWQFHNFRMLLGSDLLLFSNEKYVAISLHLWDVTRQVTPLTWLEAWLDNVMASVPELAICYHQNGVVQGYELLKTDDIFLLKGVSEDGTPAFHPHVVQQNGLSVLRFLQENCEQDPGAYWLYKSAGEDVIQLFDLSVIPSNHSSDDCDENISSLPSLMHGGRSDSMFSLGTLLYRVAHRLSLSVAPNNRARCAMFIKKCLEFLDEPDHLVVRAYAHEQFARLMLNYGKELDISECFPVECEVTVAAGEESLDFSTVSESSTHVNALSTVVKENYSEDGEGFEDLASRQSVKMYLEASISAPRKLLEVGDEESKATAVDSFSSSADENSAVCKRSSTSSQEVQTAADPISSKLTAIHHVSQAIKSLRLMRQLQSSEPELETRGAKSSDKSNLSSNLSVCACGDADCIEVCDIRQWLPTSKLDHRLWKLVLLLGESYLALGQAYKEARELHQALKVVELACSVYGSMPQHLEDAKFVSSMTLCLSSQSYLSNCVDHSQKESPYIGKMEPVSDSLPLDSSTYLFWAKAWTLVGDVHVEFHIMKGKHIIIKENERPHARGLRVSSEVVKEVKRLRKKLGQYAQNCNSCSLVNCSCQSDRASSNSSASSSTSADTQPATYGRKQGKRSHAKGCSSYSLQRDHEYNQFHQEANDMISSSSHLTQINLPSSQSSEKIIDKLSLHSVAGAKSTTAEVSNDTQNDNFLATSQSQVAFVETSKTESGGIFKYLCGPIDGDPEHNLSAALYCYDEAIKAFDGLPLHLQELQSVLKKKGWVCNELGRIRLELKEIKRAELAFEDAVKAFREVSDHVNIILISCNLGHGRRALAEEMVSKIVEITGHTNLHIAYKQALETAKNEYSESLRYYGAAKLELNVITLGADPMLNSLRNEVYTQLAHTYLRLGMLLAKEDSTAEVYDNGAVEDISVGYATRTRKTRNELGKHEISANDAIREALSLYGSLGELRRQEAAYAYFQLASWQRDRCLKFLESDKIKPDVSKCESNILQRVRQYASLAEKNWQKAAEFYGPGTHPTMYLTILLERSALLMRLSDSLHSHAMLESAVSRLLEGRHVSGSNPDSIRTDKQDLHAEYVSQLQMLFKRMLVGPLSTCTGKSLPTSQVTSVSNRSTDVGKLKELYRMSLKCTDFSQLHAIYTLWLS